MSARFDIKMTGADAIKKMLKNIETKEAAKIARKATREVCKSEILPETRNSAMRVVGGEMGSQLAAAMAVRVATKMRKGMYGSRVIIKPTDAFVHTTKDGYRYYIPSAIEYGHATRGRGAGALVASGTNKSRARKQAAQRKDVPPLPFMRNAYESKRMAAATEAANILKDDIEMYVKQNSK